MNLKIAAAAVAACLLASTADAATLLQYQLSGNAGDEASEAAINVAAGLTGQALTRGSGINGTAGANSLNSNGFDDLGANDFYSFGLNVASGTTVRITQLVFGTQSSNSGPGSINLLASVDGGSFTTLFTFAQAASATARDFAVSLSPVSSVVFRLAAASNVSANGGTIGSTGTFRVTNPTANNASNPFSINGELVAASPVPEASTWALMVAGLGIAGAAMRRRKTALTFA